MTSFGVLKHYHDRLFGDVPTIVRVDGGRSFYREDWLKFTQWRLMHTVEDALALGVEAVLGSSLAETSGSTSNLRS